ncbi:MAG: DEAD/DEAH box helicase [Deltaproteobacteria bacterium]|nr:DEAD/DEAH box helicase [Deltaproteobacteria bacterium]
MPQSDLSPSSSAHGNGGRIDGLPRLADLSSPVGQSETFQVLLSLAERKTGLIPAPLLATHVLSVTSAGDWPLQRAAMEALLRRCKFAKQDALEVASRPAGKGMYGQYKTKRAGSSERPYTTLLAGFEPLRASCDCADFVRNSLGICKHVLTVLDDLAGRGHSLANGQAAPPPPQRPCVHWHPVRPLTGKGDWLERVSLIAGGDGGSLPANLSKWFCRSDTGALIPDPAHAGTPRGRLGLVNALLSLAASQPRRRSGDGVAMEPALRLLLATEKESLERIIGNQVAAPAFQRALHSLKRKLYPYQSEGVERFLTAGRLLLADDMGLGKTVQAIAAGHALWATGKVQRGLLIVPASLKPQWLREWQLFTDTPIAVVEGGPAQRWAAYRKQAKGFLIANYEQVLRDLEHMYGWRPDLVVLDEAQRIKNWATKTAAYVKKLRPKYRLVLTGTPMENRIEELASLLDWVDDFALEPKWRLQPWHSTYTDGKKEVGGARHLDTLRQRLSGSMVRRVRSEVLRQLPPRTDTTVTVELTEAQREEHDALIQPIAQLVAIARRRPLAQAQFLRLMSLLTTQRIIANGLGQVQFATVWPAISQVRQPDAALVQTLSSPKLLELREIVTQLALEQGRKVVVFSQWRRMLQLAHWAVAGLLGERGVRAVFFTGHEGQQRRTQNIVEFHDDPNTRVLFATDAGGVGLNLQRAASSCINIELPWNPAVLEQRIGRIYRMGQKQPIDVYNLVSEASIEGRIAALVSGKRALFTGLFDGDSDEVRFDRSGSFLARLEQIVEPVQVPDLPENRDGADDTEAADRETDGVVGAADESQDVAAATAAAASTLLVGAAPPSAVDVKSLFAALEIRRSERGGITIEAPPEAAATLAALFEGMATMLRAQAAA